MGSILERSRFSMLLSLVSLLVLVVAVSATPSTRGQAGTNARSVSSSTSSPSSAGPAIRKAKQQNAPKRKEQQGATANIAVEMERELVEEEGEENIQAQQQEQQQVDPPTSEDIDDEMVTHSPSTAQNKKNVADGPSAVPKKKVSSGEEMPSQHQEGGKSGELSAPGTGSNNVGASQREEGDFTFAAQVIVVWCVSVTTVSVVLLRKKVKLAHKPRRQSHVARNSAESCLWLQRATDIAFNLFCESSMKDKQCNGISQRVASLLEDGGYAQRVDFRITTVGKTPPYLTAVLLLPSSDKRTVDFECEVLYEGGFGLTFKADIPIVRGRTLPIKLGLKELVFSFHARVKATIVMVDGRAKEISVELRMLSEPFFMFDFETALGAMPVTNTAAVCYAVRYVLVSTLRRKLLDPNFMTFSIPFPASLDPTQPSWNQMTTDVLSDSVSNYFSNQQLMGGLGAASNASSMGYRRAPSSVSGVKPSSPRIHHPSASTLSHRRGAGGGGGVSGSDEASAGGVPVVPVGDNDGIGGGGGTVATPELPPGAPHDIDDDGRGLNDSLRANASPVLS